MSQVALTRTEALVVPRQDGRRILKISDLEFTDLYLNENGMAELQGSGQAPLVQIPFNAVSDLGDLMTKAFQVAGTEQDFQLIHDAVTYRGSRIDVSNKRDGRTVVLRRLKSFVPRLATLNLDLMLMRALGFMANKTTGRGGGLILVAGSTGSGKTTTVCSILQEYLLKYGGVARTIEDPPEYPLEGSYPPHGRCFQTRVVDGDFFGPLKKVLRQAPRYILFGEIRDHASAGDLLRAAQSGHLVLATIHAYNIVEAMNSIVQLVAKDLGIEFARTLLASSLAGVMSQKLIEQPRSDGTVDRYPIVESLFFPTPTGGENSYVREGKFHQLSSIIEDQNNRIRQNLAPFSFTRE
jgi:twitching motility protein PilT